MTPESASAEATAPRMTVRLLALVSALVIEVNAMLPLWYQRLWYTRLCVR